MSNKITKVNHNIPQQKASPTEKKGSGGIRDWFNKKMDDLGTKMQHAQWFSDGDYKRIASDKTGNGVQYLREKDSEIQQKREKNKTEIKGLQIDTAQAEKEVSNIKANIKSLTGNGEIALRNYNSKAGPVSQLNKDRATLSLFTKPNPKFSLKDLKMAYTIVTGKSSDKLNADIMKNALLSSPEHKLMNHLGKINNRIMQLSAPLTDLADQIKQIDKKLDKMISKLNDAEKKIKNNKKDIGKKLESQQKLAKISDNIKAAIPEREGAGWQNQIKNKINL